MDQHDFIKFDISYFEASRGNPIEAKRVLHVHYHMYEDLQAFSLDDFYNKLHAHLPSLQNFFSELLKKQVTKTSFPYLQDGNAKIILYIDEVYFPKQEGGFISQSQWNKGSSFDAKYEEALGLLGRFEIEVAL